MHDVVCHSSEDRLLFKDEDAPEQESSSPPERACWTVLIVDDEEDVHEITRITLRGYTFENRGLRLLSAYCAQDVKAVMKSETDIALIILDVVMEKDDTGLHLVEYIRKELNNTLVRIVLRTGQPGKAPEQDVITRYDINDYKTKPDMTAQKLFTMVTACLRSYDNLKTIEKNVKGLENIIHASSRILKHQTYSSFGTHVLEYLQEVLNLETAAADIDSGYFIGLPHSSVLLMAGTGNLKPKCGQPLDHTMPSAILTAYQACSATGGETFFDDEYVGVFRTKEGFTSILYLNHCDLLSAAERYLLRIYSNHIAIGFDNISLAREIINTQKEVILTLGEIVETRSQETANHVARMAEMCYLLARKYGLDEETCEILRLASPMHDVGKIGIPEAILNKPGRLTDIEFEMMKTHARIGYEILRKSNRPIMKTAAIIALQHHERWDGQGYPQGLAGENIHIFGRIGAIADVFDALSHKRCYKPAWNIKKIIDLFHKESGGHFDPDLVKVLMDHFQEFEGINRRFPE